MVTALPPLNTNALPKRPCVVQVTPLSSVPVLLLPEAVAPATGDVRFTAGNVASYVAVRAAELVLPAPSRAVTVRRLMPGCRRIPVTDQLDVPVAVPPLPRLFVHVTCVTPTLSDA